jgi:hypothetical protein
MAEDPLKTACGCSGSPESGERKFYRAEGPWIERWAETPAGPVPVVRAKLGAQDIWGKIKVRFGIGRMNAKVRPGLYAVGHASSGSPVLVTANYTLSFDSLRRELAGVDAWILVLDTKGINVWCAAGKGTFGTDELVHRTEVTELARVVSHRVLVLPQLGAPGVAAHEVTKRTRFKIVYGPVKAADVKEFLAAGMKATPEMRLVGFDIKDRFVLTALELTNPSKYLIVLAALLWLIGLVGPRLLSWNRWYPYLGAILVGTFFVPILLPWIPGRAFAWKGWLLGLVWAGFVNFQQGLFSSAGGAWAPAAVNILLLPAISAFLAMGFTGSSTYTSLSGVLKEMRYAVPAIAISGLGGLGLLAARILGVI